MTDHPYPPVRVAPLTGSEEFHSDGDSAGFTVLTFWQWAASDLTSNLLRGVVAEYLVAQAIHAPAAVRTEWDACDLVSADGVRVEVKSAAYLQSWGQRALSSISFDIAEKRSWDRETNTSAAAPGRSSDAYVFEILAHREKATLNARDLTQWRFYVVSTVTIASKFGR